MGCVHSKEAFDVQCPECSITFNGNYIGRDLYEHLKTQHLDSEGYISVTNVLSSCPVCYNHDEAENEEKHAMLELYLNHLKKLHNFAEEKPDKPDKPDKPIELSPVKPEHVPLTGTSPLKPEPERALPKPGDKVLCLYGKWQYFHATVLQYDELKLEYYIEWDDQDPTGRNIHYSNLALNIPPQKNLIGVGTKVLFQQGTYKGNEEIGRLPGTRWHQGVITSITKQADGSSLYSGEHTKGSEDGKWVTYKGYEKQFTDYTIDYLRMPPNVFDLVEGRQHANFNTSCDIYLSYCPNDSFRNVKSGLGIKKYSDKEYESTTEPLRIKNDLELEGYVVLSNIRNNFNNELDLDKIVSAIQDCKVFISCISDEYALSDISRMEMQYAKNKAKKPLIPVVLGPGGRRWDTSVVGMIIAGERYIDFQKVENYDEKMADLNRQIEALVGKLSNPTGTISVEPVDKTCDVFISYCWTNSYLSKAANQIMNFTGSEFSDPRRIKNVLEDKYGLRVWLDIERLTSGQESGMFEQITEGLVNARCVCTFVSTEYAKSDNCKMEFQFAVKSLRKPFIPVVVGEDMNWTATVIGALVTGGENEPINLQGCTSNNDLDVSLDMIHTKIQECVSTYEDDEDNDYEEEEERDNDLWDDGVVEKASAPPPPPPPYPASKSRLSSLVPSPPGAPPAPSSSAPSARAPAPSSSAPSARAPVPKSVPRSIKKHLRVQLGQRKVVRQLPKTSRAPRPGDHVISHHFKHAYFTATILQFLKDEMSYKIAWDDGDPSGTVQKYDMVALNKEPNDDDLGIGERVFFPQGSYKGTEGNNSGGMRYHEGVIDSCTIVDDQKLYSGHHLRGDGDGKWVTYKDYSYEFHGLPKANLRIAPNALDVLALTS